MEKSLVACFILLILTFFVQLALPNLPFETIAISPTSTPSVINGHENFGCVATHFADYRHFIDTRYSAIGRFCDLKLTWKDPVNLEDGAELPTFLEGFNLKISKSGDVLVLNGVPVVFREAYSTERVVIHGIGKRLELNDQQGLKGDSFSGFRGNSARTVLDYGEF
ncbi:hypothetical protein FRX31_032533 [Thalictrum thalictroides]|uniref:Uncharacterized protein n=1 Tax=Thalictrum thalictroides TaxID=46969 RepID=A0A7J6UZK5_THATH|nr:hypothetical protein FRX31_032533 [Thalictrum thalictroides]